MTGEISVGSVDTDALRHAPHSFEAEAPVLVQGFLALSDARVEDGGFLCVPGSHAIAQDWTVLHDWHQRPFPGQLQPEMDDPLLQCTHTIPVRAGSLVIWNAFTFNANHPNRSDQWRIVQYIRMYPLPTTRFKPFAPHIDLYPDEFVANILTPLGKRLFGIIPWEATNDECDKQQQESGGTSSVERRSSHIFCC